MKRRPRFFEGTPYDLYSMMDFGDHDGQTIRWVIENDPDYLAWALDAIQNFCLTDGAMEALDIALDI